MKNILSCLLLFLIFSNKINAQCAPAPPSVAGCSGGNGAGSNGVNINGGQTFWFTGGPATWASGINLNGGTFRVCGNLTLSSLSFNSGTIIIESGGSLTINIGGDLFLNGNSSICNRGTFKLNTNLRMQNANNTIWNIGSVASFSVAGQIEINSSTSTIRNNGGSIMVGSIVVQGSASVGAVCMQVGSCFTCNGGANSIINNSTNAWTFSGTGIAAIIFNGNAQLNNPLTASSNVIICRNAGATTSGSGGWGSATLTITPCPNCSVALPIELLYFTAELCNNSICLNWATATESNSDFFTIEKSSDGIEFNAIQNVNSIAIDGNSSIKLNYGVYDILPNVGINYYRLKQTDHDGKYIYSNITAIEYNNYSSIVTIFPNPFSNKIIVTANNSLQVKIIDASGLLNSKTEIQNNSTLSTNTENLTSGIYFIIASDNAGNIVRKERLIKR